MSEPGSHKDISHTCKISNFTSRKLPHLVIFRAVVLNKLSGSLKEFSSIPNPEAAMASIVNFPYTALASITNPDSAAAANISSRFPAHFSI